MLSGFLVTKRIFPYREEVAITKPPKHDLGGSDEAASMATTKLKPITR